MPFPGRASVVFAFIAIGNFWLAQKTCLTSTLENGRVDAVKIQAILSTSKSCYLR
jgi:hypothetical protein